MRSKKEMKIKNKVVKNLNYLYYKGIVDAIEKDMENSEPVQIENDRNVITRFLSSIVTEIANNVRRKNTLELSTEKAQAIEVLNSFEKSVDEKELDLAKDLEAFKKYLNKKMFKKDKYNLKRKAFALSYVMNVAKENDRIEGLEAVSSVLFDDAGYMADLFKKFEKNFYGIQKPAVGELQAGLIGGLGIWSLSVFSIIPVAIGGVATLVSHVANRIEMKKAFKTLSTDELHAYIAMKLTLIEESREVMSEEEWKSLADEFLKYISNLRGDAEYNWLIEKVDGQRNKELIELCNLTIAQLSKIIGI